MSYGSDFVFTLFTNEPELAKVADVAGINRIGLDLEKLGKDRRQDVRKAWVSDHQVAELAAIRGALTNAELFARTNPVHEGLADEIDFLIESGVQVLMLPMFRTRQEAAAFIDMVNGRAKVSLLVETGAAAMRLHEIVKLDGVDEIHIGLNDMHLDLSLANHFEVLTSGFVDMLADIVHGSRHSIWVCRGGAGKGRAPACSVRSDLFAIPAGARNARLNSTVLLYTGLP